MKLKLNKCIGPNSNCRQLYNKKILSLCKKNLVEAVGNNQPLHPPPTQPEKMIGL